MRSKNCIAVTLLVALLSSCMGRMVGGGSGAPGGEVTGVSTTAWNEPAPYGMVLIKRGSLKMGPEMCIRDRPNGISARTVAAWL